MNDSTQTLLRSILKIGAGYLLSKGVIDQSGSEDLIAAILGIAGVIWGLLHRNAANLQVKGPLLALMVATLAFSPGCMSSPQRIAYNVEAGTEITVDQAMQLWDAYVAEFKVSAADEIAVKNDFEKYQAAALLAVDVTGTAAQRSLATQTAANALGDLVNLLRSLGVKL